MYSRLQTSFLGEYGQDLYPESLATFKRRSSGLRIVGLSDLNFSIVVAVPHHVQVLDSGILYLGVPRHPERRGSLARQGLQKHLYLFSGANRTERPSPKFVFPYFQVEVFTCPLVSSASLRDIYVTNSDSPNIYDRVPRWIFVCYADADVFVCQEFTKPHLSC